VKPSQAIGLKPTPSGIVSCGAFNGTSAQGIVTRMGHDLGHGGEAIEPGPAGMRPVSGSQLSPSDRRRERARATRELIRQSYVGPSVIRPSLNGRFDQQNAVRSFAFDPQALVNRCEVKSAGDGAGTALAGTSDGARAGPLGNTGTTTLEAAP